MSFEEEIKKKTPKDLEKAEFKAKLSMPLASYRYYLWRKEKGVPEEEAAKQAINYFMKTFPAYSSMEPEELEEIAEHFFQIGNLYILYGKYLKGFANEIREKNKLGSERDK